MQVGTMRNGLLSEQPNTTLSGKVKDSYLLPRPGALSKSSPQCRPPGNTKSEAKAKKLGILQKNEVYNPDWLEIQFGLPIGWTSPQECRAATQLLALVEPPSEIVLTPDLPKLPSDGYSTSTPTGIKVEFMPHQVKESRGNYSASTDFKLKAISLWQPWASLIPLSLKQYETRSWKTNYRGKLLICSTATNTKQEYQQYLKICEELQVPPWEETNFPHGQAIAVCDLVDCIEMTTEFIEQQSPTEILCGDWQVGRYAWKLENIHALKAPFAVKGKQGLFSITVTNLQLLEKENFNSNFPLQKQLPPNLTSEQLLGDIEISPSKVDLSPSKRRQRGLGSGYIHWRTITKNGKDYPQAYYHWKEKGQKQTKYIPKKLLGLIQEAEAAKRPVIEILGLLGVTVSPSNLLGDIEISPSNDGVLPDIQVSPSNSGVLGDIEISPSNDADIDPSNSDISPSKMRRHKGEGSGSIHWRTITKGGKDYPQAHYHYEFWNGGDRLIKSTKYIPKRLMKQVQGLEQHKAPVREILKVLGVVE